MILYHGTSESSLKEILNQGIIPRGRNGKDNWGHTVSSNPECIYLTSTYPGYFAAVASRGGNDKWAIIEVDIDRLDISKFRPDEDCIEQLFREYDLMDNMTLGERTLYYQRKIEDVAEFWQESLRFLGTCAYKGAIPVSAFRRVILYDPKSNQLVTSKWLDPSISLINFKVMGDSYRMATRWFFGESMDYYEFLWGRDMTLKMPSLDMNVAEETTEMHNRSGVIQVWPRPQTVATETSWP